MKNYSLDFFSVLNGHNFKNFVRINSRKAFLSFSTISPLYSYNWLKSMIIFLKSSKNWWFNSLILLSSKMTRDSSIFLTIISNIFFSSSLDKKFSRNSMLTFYIILRINATLKKPMIPNFSSTSISSFFPLNPIAIEVPPIKTQV